MKGIKELSSYLEEIKQLYKNFIDIIKQERVYIINTKMNEYSEILSKKVSLSKKIEKCDSNIEDSVKAIQEEYKMEEFSFANIEKLYTVASTEEREYLFKISELKGELKEILTKVTKENKVNEELLLDHIEFANNILKIFETEKVGYSKTGSNKNRSSDGGFIDRMG